MAAERKLTKKEKKAQAFRANKGKAKTAQAGNEQDVQDVPESDLVAEDEQPRQEQQQQHETQESKDKSKKRKRQHVEEQDDDTTAPAATDGDDKTAAATATGDDAPKKKRQRGSKKSNQAQEDDKSSRLVVFVGNMPYDVTVDQIKEFFSSCGEEPQVRLLTPKVSKYDKNKPITKSKGCAFVEFTQATSLQSALKKHGSEMGTRKVNVELTAGGGGNSDQRKKKIQDKRKMLNEEREKAAKNKRKRDGEPVVDKVDGVRQWGKNAATDGGEQADGEGSTDSPAKPKTTVREIISKDGYRKKVRDRRLQKKEEKKEKKAFVAQRNANARKQGRGGGGGGRGTSGAKMPWMTGANAVKLG
ncbi:hypothetical protein OIV83_000023 [Microbotryomycetes sp. JL201]|nr:hypothetical protein OIV83_000023 [Microbotryomycetes sp. JL201]